MKKYLLILLLSPVIGHSQQYPMDTEDPIVYEQIFLKDGISKTDLFTYTKRWIVNTFNSADAVIQTEDKESGEIVGKGSFEFTSTATDSAKSEHLEVGFMTLINVKDGKVRIRFYNLERIVEVNGEVLVNSIDVINKNMSKGVVRTGQSLTDWWHLMDEMKSKFIDLMEDYSISIDKYHHDKF